MYKHIKQKYSSKCKENYEAFEVLLTNRIKHQVKLTYQFKGNPKHFDLNIIKE